jgi:hypothetical protein
VTGRRRTSRRQLVDAVTAERRSGMYWGWSIGAIFLDGPEGVAYVEWLSRREGDENRDDALVLVTHRDRDAVLAIAAEHGWAREVCYCRQPPSSIPRRPGDGG